MADGGHVFREIGFFFGTCTTRHWGEHSDQDLKKSDQSSWRKCDDKPVNGKFHCPSRESNGQICRQTGILSVLAHLGIEANTIGKFHSNLSSSFWGDAISRKKNQRWTTAALFVDGPEFFLILAQLDTEGNILTKFKKKSDHWSWRRCDNKKCLQTDSWTDGRRRVPGP